MPIERVARWTGPAVAGVLLCCAGPGQAILDTRPFGSLSYERDDNVYRFTDSEEAMEQRGSPTLEDSVRKLSAGTWVDFAYGRQALRALGAFHQYRYGEFSELDRTENEFEGRLDWTAGIPWSGYAVYERARTLEALTSRDSVERGFQKREEAEFFAGYALTPSWQLQAAAGALRKRLTRLDAQNSNLDEARARFGFAYASAIGIAGAAVEGRRGEFPDRGDDSAAGVAREYDQTDYLVHARNDISGVSTFETEFGLTSRSSPSGARDFQGVTGRLRYQWRWLSKTTVEGQIFRRLRDVEERDANYVDEVGTKIVVTRSLTHLLSAVAEAQLANQDYRGSPAAGNDDGAPREDHMTGFQLGLTYAPRPWISLKPLVRQERRMSNRDGRRYDFTTAGLTLEIRSD